MFLIAARHCQQVAILEQADGTAWMAFLAKTCLNCLSNFHSFDAAYEEMALKFVEHFLWIAAAMIELERIEMEMWDEEDGFYYDLLRFPDGSATRLKVRSIVGLLPLCCECI